MMVAPSLPGKVMSWPSIDGSFAGTDSGLCATGDGEATADAAGAAAGEGEATGFAAGDGLAAGEAAIAGDAAAAGAVVGFGGVVGAVVGCAAGWGAQPRASSIVAVEATPPVMFRTRRTRSRRERCPSLKRTRTHRPCSPVRRSSVLLVDDRLGGNASVAA